MGPGETETLRPGAYRLALDRCRARLWADRRWSIPAMLLPGVGAVLTWFCPPLVVAAMLRRFGGGARPQLDEVVPYLLAFGAAWYGGELVWRAGIHCLNRAASQGVATLYEEGMAELLEKDLSFFHDSFSGSLTKRLTSVAASYEMLVDTLAFRVAPSLVPLPFVGAVLWGFSPVLPLVLVGSVVFTGLVVSPLIVRRQRLVNQRERASADIAAHVADSITNMDAVRLFGREREELRVHGANVRRWRLLAQRSWDYSNQRIDMVTSVLYVLTNVGGVALAIRLGGDAFDIAAIVVTFTYFLRCTDIVWEFNQIYRTIETQLSTIAQFTELLLEPPTVVDPVDPEPASFRDASIEVRDVWFRYPKRTEPLFRGLDLRIEHGERVGLVGRSGGGKSTLTRLLLRLTDIDAGTISIGGCDIARIRQADVRDQVSYVPQDPAMFHRSIRENIAVGRPDATDEEIRAAAVAAHAAEFVELLPDGYDTLVGERGIKLSGGQRQRLAIARAVLRAAPILVLDEATSSLDSASEALIQHALLSVMADRTALVIAHRLSTVRAMDRLVVLQDGAVAEQGSHDELLALDGAYAELWRTQSGGFIGALGAAG